jgi:hypothetical protein
MATTFFKILCPCSTRLSSARKRIISSRSALLGMASANAWRKQGVRQALGTGYIRLPGSSGHLAHALS